MGGATASLVVTYSLHERFEHFVVDIQDYYAQFSWEEAPLHDVVYPLATGVIYTLVVILWACTREAPFPAGSREEAYVAREAKQTEAALKPFVGAPRSCSCRLAPRLSAGCCCLSPLLTPAPALAVLLLAAQRSTT